MWVISRHSLTHALCFRTTEPSSIIKITSDIFFSASLWVKRMIVLLLFKLSNGGISSASLSASNAAVGSSSRRYLGCFTSARARAIRALCPPDSKQPPWPTWITVKEGLGGFSGRETISSTCVWYPCGNVFMKSWACAETAAASISSWVASN